MGFMEEITDGIKEGIKEAKRGNTLLGLNILQQQECSHIPAAKAWYGYCLAYEKNEVKAGVNMCKESMSSSPRLADGYLALGRIYLANGRKKQAIEILKQGLVSHQNQEIKNLLDSIGIRKKPVFPSLGRGHAINVSLGRALSKIGLR